MRKALELKEGALKAFFIKASATQKRPWGSKFAAANGRPPAKGTQPRHTRAGARLLHESAQHRAADCGHGSQAEGTARTEGKAQPAHCDTLSFLS